ncbi:hypothetical protein [Phenylobacterium sp.]|uniref:hypothetical protein n=1 Tax=Phenylobacterium sp. TaxID=1871053 RepID=UPI00289A9C4D|nr:hypothetical protein [Phenylobacterium sp.]
MIAPPPIVERARAALARVRQWLKDWPLTLERIADGGGWRANPRPRLDAAVADARGLRPA